MKTKLILFILSLLCSVGMWAATPAAGAYPVVGKTYYLYALQKDKSRSYLYNDDGTLKVSNGSKTNADKYKWTVTKSGSNYIIQNVAGKYISIASWSLALSSSSKAFDLGQGVSDGACVSIYENDATYGDTYYCAPKASGAFAANAYFTSYRNNDNYSSNFVFEEVLSAHSLTNNAYYRIYCDNDSKQYLYDNSGTLTIANDPSMTHNYVWKCIVNDGKYNFQNVATSNYLSHKAVNASAYNFTISTDGVYHDGCATIYSDAASKYMGMSSSGGFDQANGHTFDKVTTDYSFDWRFVPLKIVTFSTAVSVNGGAAVSTLYVATDGSDSFTLPEGYLYSVNGATEVSNTLAASAIAAAGTSNMTVTVNAEVINAVSQIGNNKYYHIFTKNNGSDDGLAKYYLTSDGSLTSDEASAGEFFFTKTSESQYVNTGYAYLITPNNGTNYFTNSDAAKDNHIHSTTNNKRQNWEAQVFYWNGSKFAVRATNSTNGSGYRCEEFWTVKADADSDGVPEADYDATTNTKHYVWEIEETGTVTYNLVFQGETMRTMYRKRSEVLGAAALPTDSWNHACCEYSFEPSTIDGETETVDVTMTWNVGDLTFSSDYASATWYHMSLHNKWAKYNKEVNGTDGHPLYSDKNNVNYDVAGFAGMWAFVGNPLDGVYVINREAGNGKVLGWTTPPRMQGTNEGSSKRFVLGKKSDTEFTLSYSGFYVNDLDGAGKLKFWNNGSGATADGSAITVEDISLYELSLIELDEYASEHAEGEYFGVTSSAVTSLRNSIKTAKASYNAAAYSAAHSAIEALWPGTDNANVVFPESGFYYIKSAGSRNWGSAYISYSSTGLVTQTSKDLNSVFYFSKESSVYKLSVQGLNLQPFTSHSQQARVTEDSGCDVTLRPSSTPGMGLIENSISGNPTYPSYSKFFHEDGSQQVVSWESNAEASTWAIEEVESATVTLNSDGAGTYYATLCVPFSYTVSDATAYTLERSGSWLIPTAVEGAVPAGTPVVLKGTSSTATLTISGTDYAATPTDDTALTGTYLAKTIDGTTDYVFGKSDGVVGFYHWDRNNLGANRAYVDTPVAGVKGFALLFDEEETSIANVNINGNGNNAAIYNMAGQKLSKLQKGINIVNGKKVLY